MRTTLSAFWAVFLAAGFVLTSCSGSVRYTKSGPPSKSTEVAVAKNGPPPHAPAHGYRHKHGNVVLVFQANLGLYVVDGHQGYYYHEGEFYRSHKGKWQASAHFNGPWKKVSESKLPKGLNNAQHAKAKKNK